MYSSDEMGYVFVDNLQLLFRTVMEANALLKKTGSAKVQKFLAAIRKNNELDNL